MIMIIQVFRKKQWKWESHTKHLFLASYTVTLKVTCKAEQAKNRELKLPGLELVDQNADYSGTQTILIDFDGVNGASYDNYTLNIHIHNIDVKDSGLSEKEQFTIIADLNTTFAAITELVSGVTKITASDATADDMFGNSVAIDGDNVVVGTYYTEVIPGKKENSASYNLDLDITYNSI
jgi:FG-GAP repeat protein